MFRYLTLLCCCCFLSCSDILKKGDSVTEGIITYNVEFPKVEKGGMMSMMLPRTAKFFIKDQKLRSELVMGLGLMKTTYIADYDKKIASVLLDLPSGKKYLYQCNEKDVQKQRKGEPELEFYKTNETKNLAGYVCKKLMVVNKKTKETYLAYYTEAIGIEEVNWNTPYDEVEGFLMDYYITLYNIDMKLTAKQIETIAVSDSLFTIPRDYKRISKKDFDRIINSLMKMENI